MNPEEFDKEARRLINRMMTVGVKGEYFGGFSGLSETGRTIIACAKIIRESLDSTKQNGAS